MFDVEQLRLQIEALLRDYPDLAEDEILRADMLDAETDLYSVLVSLLNVNDDSKTLVEAIDARMRQLKARKSRFERRVEFLRELMLRLMQSAELRRIELPDGTLLQRKGSPKVIGELDGDLLPDDLVTILRQPNKTAIREALEAHRDLPGLKLSNAAPILAINTK